MFSQDVSYFTVHDGDQEAILVLLRVNISRVSVTHVGCYKSEIITKVRMSYVEAISYNLLHYPIYKDQYAVCSACISNGNIFHYEHT